MGAKKKEIKEILLSAQNQLSNLQSVDKVSIPQTSKQTEVIEGDTEAIVARIVDVLKKDIKVI
jgi:electron transfer flavoprotein alpha/beta subunit